MEGSSKPWKKKITKFIMQSLGWICTAVIIAAVQNWTYTLGFLAGVAHAINEAGSFIVNSWGWKLAVSFSIFKTANLLEKLLIFVSDTNDAQKSQSLERIKE